VRLVHTFAERCGTENLGGKETERRVPKIECSTYETGIMDPCQLGIVSISGESGT